MGFKKYDGSAWQSITPKKLKGIPYTGTLPATITGTKAGYLHRYKIYGNTEQTGTPTPENPIYPSECGERTENLCDESTLLNGYYETTSYQYSPNDNYRCFSLSLPAGTYTLFAKSDTLIIRLLRVSSASLGANPVNRDNQSYAFTLPVAETIYVSLRNSTTTNDFTGLTTMLNTGITPRPYEPYGYKLPLTSAGQNVDIYLGESQTTRQIRKLVLTGEENWGYNDSNHTAYLTTLDSFLGEGVSVISTHYTAVSNKTVYTQLSDKQCCLRANGNYLWIRDNDYSTAANFKVYLQQQYANGTPVTVWYVLATAETGTLNEPLRKIGNYADTIDSTQTTAQIPTSAGSTTISWAGEGLAPSQFDSIQEWVDIPTYTYTNGEWVADNSN